MKYTVKLPASGTKHGTLPALLSEFFVWLKGHEFGSVGSFVAQVFDIPKELANKKSGKKKPVGFLKLPDGSCIAIATQGSEEIFYFGSEGEFEVLASNLAEFLTRMALVKFDSATMPDLCPARMVLKEEGYSDKSEEMLEAPPAKHKELAKWLKGQGHSKDLVLVSKTKPSSAGRPVKAGSAEDQIAADLFAQQGDAIMAFLKKESPGFLTSHIYFGGHQCLIFANPSRRFFPEPLSKIMRPELMKWREATLKTTGHLPVIAMLKYHHKRKQFELASDPSAYPFEPHLELVKTEMKADLKRHPKTKIGSELKAALK